MFYIQVDFLVPCTVVDLSSSKHLGSSAAIRAGLTSIIDTSSNLNTTKTGAEISAATTFCFARERG